MRIMKIDSIQTKGKNRAKKEAIVAELSTKIQKAKSIVFTNYQGLTHVQLEHLKKALKKADAELVVAKNTLLKLALDQTQNDSEFEGPTATIFSYSDPIMPLKALAKTIKELKLPIIKFGFFENKNISADEITKLASLPPREVLIAQFVGTLKSPLYGLHRALNWNIQKLVLTLYAIQQNKF